jgi:hypothetical protein
MKHLFFDQWKKNRVNKIVNIFGKDWFPGKKIHEFGCAHGEVGEELLRLGAEVDFSDVREENLDEIHKRFKNNNYIPNTQILDQNKPYELKRHYDLLLHFGLLYTLPNWKQDLECAMKHSNLMMLESIVLPESGVKETLVEIKSPLQNYTSVADTWAMNTEEAIEKHLTDLGCKYIKFNNRSLNTTGWLDNRLLLNNVYDWIPDINTYDMNHKNNETNKMYFYRRMWLVIK